MSQSNDWLTIEQAAEALGLSASGFRGLAGSESIEIRRRGRQPGVRRADLDAYLERARIRPGEIQGGRPHSDRHGHEPFARQFDNDVPGLVEVAVLHDELGWTDQDVADALGIHYSVVSRRRVNGFRPGEVDRLRRAWEAAMNSSQEDGGGVPG